jgi:hypothetical protein
LTFPEFVPRHEREKIESSLYSLPTDPKKLDRILPEPILLNYLASINMAEIRTLINLHLVAPIFYTFAPAEHKNSVMNLLHSLQSDEIKHISYTAKIINSTAVGSGSVFVKDMYERNLEEFGAYSLRGLEDAVKTYGGGNFFDLIRK